MAEYLSDVKCRFGLIADIQHADRGNGYNFSKTRKRYYKESLEHLDIAIKTWREQQIEFVLDLGDVVDGSARFTRQSRECLTSVLTRYKDLQKPVYYNWGNHELYNFKRNVLVNISALNSSKKREVCKPHNTALLNYYHWSPCAGFRIVALDPFELSVLGYHQDHPTFKSSEQMLRSINKNKDLHSAKGLPDSHRRFVKFNGGISQTQLDWLDDVLTQSDKNQENVAITSHVPVSHEAANHGNIIWNAEEVLAVLHKHQCVRVFFAGHYHEGGYSCDDRDIHHITLHGVIESEPGNHTYAVAQLTKDSLHVNGYGRIPEYFHVPLHPYSIPSQSNESMPIV